MNILIYQTAAYMHLHPAITLIKLLALVGLVLHIEIQPIFFSISEFQLSRKKSNALSYLIKKVIINTIKPYLTLYQQW